MARLLGVAASWGRAGVGSALRCGSLTGPFRSAAASSGGRWPPARQSSPRSILCCGASDSLLHRTRRGTACLGSARQWPAARKGRELAHPSRVRLGEFRMASLARGTRSAAHARSLRRAWMRSFGPRCGGAVARTLGGRPRDGCRRGWLGPVRPARDIPGRGHRRRVQRSASGSRGPAGPLWRLRAGTGPARRAAARAFGRLDLCDPDRMDRPRSDVSPPLHDAVPAAGQPRADGLV